ncbi:unnamed protein product [Heligmosomoides polygyrus]|uniref:VHL domain-containing protein n=1 Tax=Heligmosomoides polygyrus TaxID=6339 RepID=A0A3P7YWI9_HELPZ|nr:unnamed protein product [Heligmosomoides polygyrus]
MVASEASELEELFGLITGVTESRYLNEWIGFVWTRHCRDGRQGILHLGYNEAEAWAFTPGKWIQFAIPSNYAWKVFNTANQDRPRLELVPEDCTIVKPLFDTFVSRDSVESWAPRHTRKEKIKRPPQPAPVQQPTQKQQVPPKSPTPSCTSKNAAKKDESSSEGSEESYKVVAKPLDEDQEKQRHKVTSVAMVEEYLEAKQKYRVWLLEYHREAEFCSANRVLQPGHFFQGRFSIGGQHKSTVMGQNYGTSKHKRLPHQQHLTEASPNPPPWAYAKDEPGRRVRVTCGSGRERRFTIFWVRLSDGARWTVANPNTSTSVAAVYVDALHTNRKNGRCFEVYHEYLGYVVHLQIPCYDFYPVQAIAIELFPAIPRPEGLDTAVRSPLETAQSRTATGGVYKWQGRNQRELMTHTY